MYETGVTARGRSPVCGTLLAMALIGYARVSTRDQNPEAQHAALRAAGCERIFSDTASGKLAERPELAACLDYLRAGDTLVCTKLDRLGRSVKHLVDLVLRLGERRVDLTVTGQAIDTATPGGKLLFHVLAAIAEFERDLIRERTRDGLDAARAKGNNGGRRPGLTELQAAEARPMYNSLEYTVTQIAGMFRVSRQTIYRHLGGHHRQFTIGQPQADRTADVHVHAPAQAAADRRSVH